MEPNAGNIITGAPPTAPTIAGQEPVHRLLDEVQKSQDSMRGLIEKYDKKTDEWSTERAEILAAAQATRDELNVMKGRLETMDKFLPRGQKQYIPQYLDGIHPLQALRVIQQDNPALDEFAKWTHDQIAVRLDKKPKFNTEAFQRSQTEGTDADGGYLVPPEQLPEIVQIRERYSVCRQLFRVLPMKGKELRIPTLTTRPTVYWPDESAAPASDSKAVFARPAITAKRLMAVDTLSLEIDEDSIPLIREFLPDVFMTAVAKEEDRTFLKGQTGSGDAFNGLLYISGVQDYTFAASTAFTGLTYADLLNVMDAPNAFASENGVYLMSNSVRLIVRGLLDTQDRPLWQEMSLGDPNSLFGRPLKLSDVMPKQADTGAATPFILYGDFKNAAIGDRMNLQIDFSPHQKFDEGNLVMRVMERVGYQLLLGAGIARIKTHA